jgi:hypothetical protein
LTRQTSSAQSRKYQFYIGHAYRNMRAGTRHVISRKCDVQLRLPEAKPSDRENGAFWGSELGEPQMPVEVKHLNATAREGSELAVIKVCQVVAFRGEPACR